MGKSRAVSVDVGTMFFQVAEMADDKIKVKNTRNAFVELPPNDDIEDVSIQIIGNTSRMVKTIMLLATIA
jgi:hypothetical protein